MRSALAVKSAVAAVAIMAAASSVIMWTGELLPHEVDDPEVFAVVLASSATSGRLFRLEGTGRVLVEQAAGQ